MKNRVNLIGRMGADAEIRSTQNGDKVANFNLATTETWKDKNGERQQATEWIRVEVWGPRAEVIEKYTRKGSLLDIEGKLRTEEWQDKDGNKRYTTKVRANNIILLDSKSEGSQGGSQQKSETDGGSQGFKEGEDDDLPF
jgi:single-strand DNA-binding protein